MDNKILKFTADYILSVTVVPEQIICFQSSFPSKFPVCLNLNLPNKQINKQQKKQIFLINNKYHMIDCYEQIQFNCT